MTNAVEHYLDRHVTEGRAGRSAVATADRLWTYGELLDRVERAADVLAGLGVKPRDRVLVVLPDSPEAIVFLFGAMRIGAIPAPISPQMTGKELAIVCTDCRPAAVVTAPAHVALFEASARAGAPSAIVTTGRPPSGTGAIDAELALAAAQRRGPEAIDDSDAALLQYTSGSTGAPKGVVHLHRGLIALPEGFGRRLLLSEHDVCYSTAKLSFGYGLGNSVLLPFAAGASSFLRAGPSGPIDVLETIESARPTLVFAGPATYAAILTVHGASRRFGLASVRLFVSAGESLDASLFLRWKQEFGRGILDGLGSTECLHVFISGEPGRLRPGTLGTAVPPYRVKLVDDDGTLVGDDEIGHLYVRGPANGARYWSATADLHREWDWVRTGDLLARERDGSFRYIGRSDDVFMVRGMKVAPLEVESRLNSHPAVAESAVVGSIDRHGMTAASAFVHVAAGWTAGPELARALRSHLSRALSSHKVPRRIEFVDALPRGNTGKLLRHELRQGAARPVTDSSPTPSREA